MDAGSHQCREVGDPIYAGHGLAGIGFHRVIEIGGSDNGSLAARMQSDAEDAGDEQRA